MRIEKLTEEQEKLLPVYRDKWLAIGLSTEKCDRQKAEDAAKRAYLVAGLTPPNTFVWCDSPLSLVLTDAILRKPKRDSVSASVWASAWDSVWASVRASVSDSVSASVWASAWDSVRASVSDSVWASAWDSVRASVRASVRDSVSASVWDSVSASVRASVRDSAWDSVRASVRDSVRDSVRASVSDSVRASVWASVLDSVWASVRASVRDSVSASVRASVLDSVSDSVWASVWASVRASVRASVLDSVWASVYGSQDAHWLSFYDYFLGLGLKEPTKLQPLMDLAQDCGWWVPRGNVCLMSEKPNLCLLQDSVIHSENSPAIRYSDGFSVWAINGIRVDEQIVMRPETQTVDQIRNETNEDVKRIRVARYGWERYLEEVGAVVLDVSVGRWAESLMACSDGLKILCTVDPATDPSTGRQLCFLEVDSSCQTCEQAQRYLLAPEVAFERSGVNVDEIKTYPMVRT